MIARSGLYPQLNASASAARQKSGTFNGTSFAALGGPRNSYEALLNASWEIDLWGRIANTVDANELSAIAAYTDLESLKLSLQTQLVQSYLSLRVADEQIVQVPDLKAFCDDVLVQLAAVTAALDQVGLHLIGERFRQCTQEDGELCVLELEQSVTTLMRHARIGR